LPRKGEEKGPGVPTRGGKKRGGTGVIREKRAALAARSHEESGREKLVGQERRERNMTNRSSHAGFREKWGEGSGI